MEANICDVNQLDADVLLPPRKRLLAGLRKQGADADASFHLPPPVAVASSSSPPPSPSFASSSFAFNMRLNNLLSSHSNANLSPAEIVEASRSSAVAAVKAAEVARAAAEEKAAIAAKAVAAAKTAMDLVASISEEAACKEISPRKNKLKKHVPVQLLYTKYQPVENCKTDEELARKLHRAINSSPRIMKNSSSPDVKGQKRKKRKCSPGTEKTRVNNCSIPQELNPSPTCNGHANNCEVGSECCYEEAYRPKTDEKTSKYDKDSQSAMDNGEADTSQKEKTCDDASVTVKKRGRVKLKKLPLSICSFRDQATLNKEEIKNGSSPILTMQKMGSPTSGNVIIHSVDNPTEGMMPIDSTSRWKCQEYKAPISVKQNKVMQS